MPMTPASAGRQTWRGSCHCQDVRFEVDADASEVMECNCSICDRKAYLHLIVPQQDFRLLTPPDSLAEYRFGTGVARHRFCKRCGIHPFYTPRSHPDRVSVNARCLEGLDLATVRRVPFDGRDWENAYARLNDG